MVGSPMGVFAATQKKELKLPVGTRVVNLFHPTDPVAYRLEPLLHPNYRAIATVLVHYAANAIDAPPYQEAATVKLKAPKRRTGGRALSRSPSRSSIFELVGGEQDDAPTPPLEGSPASADDDIEVGQLAMELERTASATSFDSRSSRASESQSDDSHFTQAFGKSLETLLEEIRASAVGEVQPRIDYTLRQAYRDGPELYSALFTSHYKYWTSPDTIHFLIALLYPQLVHKSALTFGAAPNNVGA